jgi:lipoprotein-anchoring transpeptidase ErfK/SrfK
MLMGVLSATTVVGISAYAVTHRNRGNSSANNSKKPGTALIAVTPTAEAVSVTPSSPHLVKSPAGAPTTAPATKPAAAAAQIKAEITSVTPDAARPQSSGAKSDEPRLASSSAGPLADGKAKLDAGELLAGRKLLNAALIGGQLTPGDAATAKKLIAEANKSLIFAPRRFNDDPYASGHPVANGENLQKIANKYSLTPELLLRINGLSDARKLRAGASIKVLEGPFHAVVTKKTFTIDLYLGSPGEKNALYVTTYGVGLGKDDSTPTGTWLVEQRVPNPKWWGARGLAPIEAGDPKNPLGKYWIALTGIDGKAEGQQSYGIHGTIEPETIGKQASMGCIRMRNEDVAMVYEMLVAQKSIVIVRD